MNVAVFLLSHKIMYFKLSAKLKLAICKLPVHYGSKFTIIILLSKMYVDKDKVDVLRYQIIAKISVE